MNGPYTSGFAPIWPHAASRTMTLEEVKADPSLDGMIKIQVEESIVTVLVSTVAEVKVPLEFFKDDKDIPAGVSRIIMERAAFDLYHDVQPALTAKLKEILP